MLLAGLALGALVVRVLYVMDVDRSPFGPTLIGDSLQFDVLARRILAGEWAGVGALYQGQLYAYVLAAVYAAFGDSAQYMRLVQAASGAASCVLIAIAGARFFDRRSGLLAGGMLAVYPPAIFFDGLIQKSSVDLFLIGLLLLALGSFIESRRLPWVLLAGVAVGALAWNRENARILYPVVALWLVFAWQAPWKARARSLAILTLGAALVLLPVTVRNLRLTGEPLLTTAQFGPNFYIGNHHGATGGYRPLVPGRGNARFEQEDAIRVAEAAAGRKLALSEVSDYWFDRAIDDIRREPAAWLRLMARKTWLTFAAHEALDTESLEAYADQSWILRVLRPFTFGIVMALALAGAWVTRHRWRHLVVLYSIFGALAASVIVFFVFARYRFPLVPIAMLFAGAGLSALLTWEHDRRSRVAVATLGLLLAAALHLPARTSADETYFNYGSEFLRLGRPGDAIPMLREALRVDPAHPEAGLSLALALQQAGQADAALEVLRTAVARNPASPKAHAGLAIALHQHGDLKGAVAAYQEALRLAPDSVEVMSNLGLALHEAGRTDDAIALFERAARASPRSPSILMNLGRAYLESGRVFLAVDAFQRTAAASATARQVLEAEYALAQALAGAGQGQAAVSALHRALAAARKDGDAVTASRIERTLGMLGTP